MTDDNKKSIQESTAVTKRRFPASVVRKTMITLSLSFFTVALVCVFSFLTVVPHRPESIQIPDYKPETANPPGNATVPTPDTVTPSGKGDTDTGTVPHTSENTAENTIIPEITETAGVTVISEATETAVCIPENLFDGKFEYGTILKDGSEADSDSTVRTGFVDVKPSCLYTLGTYILGEPFLNGKIVEYDKNHEMISYCIYNSGIGPRSFTTSSRTQYIRWFSLSSVYSTPEHAAEAGYFLEEGNSSYIWEKATAGLIHDLPENSGVKNVLDRISIFCDTLIETAGSGLTIGYTDYDKVGTVNPYGMQTLEKHSVIYGFPYSSVRKTNTYIGLEVSLDTYFSALRNPASIVYTDNYRLPESDGYTSGIYYAWCPYGSVCSSMLDYALDLDFVYSTYEWVNIDGMVEVDANEDGVKLGDCLCNVIDGKFSGGHISVITDILRDNEGNIQYVEITEAGIPTMLRTYITGQYFLDGYLSLYSIYRYDKIASVPPCESIYAGDETKINRDLSANLGDFSVYPIGNRVNINIMSSEAEFIIIENESSLEKFPVDSSSETLINGVKYLIFSYTPENSGKFYAYLQYKNGETSRKISWITASSGMISTDSAAVGTGENVKVSFSGYSCCKPLGICIETTMYVTRFHRLLTEDEIRMGCAEISYKYPGKYYVKIIYENEYGRICSERIALMINE